MKKKVEKALVIVLMAAIGVMTISAAMIEVPFLKAAFAVSMFCAALCLFILVPMEVPVAQSWYEEYKDNDDIYLGL